MTWSRIAVMAALVLAAHWNLPAADDKPVEIGTRRELFVDRFLIEKLTDARLQLHEPRDEGVAVKLDRPYEGLFSGYTTLLKVGDGYRMYYRGLPVSRADGSTSERTCMAESRDGIHWTKPELGLFDYEGSKANNIVLADAAPVTHNFSPFVDERPGVPDGERFKAMGGVGDALFAFTSADGLRWTKVGDTPVLSSKNIPFEHRGRFDSQNLAFWSVAENCYVCYFRVVDTHRRIARSTSTDFRTWTPAVLMQQVHDDGTSGPQPAPDEHLYTNQTSPYFRAPHVSLAIAARFFAGRQVLTDEQAKAIQVDPKYFRDTSDAVLMSTRGGNVYDRTFLEGFLKPGIGPRNWVSRTNYPALNLVQTGPAELSLYVNQEYAQPTSHVRRYSLRLDGFASVRAGAKPGELLTRPFTFGGKSLSINFATSAAGGLKFELQDLDGKPIPGFTLKECREQIGNEIDRTVAWTSNKPLASLAGKPVRMRVSLKDADLYSFRFEE